MRVLVHEQEFTGHYFHYLSHILPQLSEIVDEVVVAITPNSTESSEYKTLLEPLKDRVNLQPVLPLEDAALSLKSRLRLLGNLKETIRRFRPDYVLVPSGDGHSSAMGLISPLGQGSLPGGVPAEVGIHYGYGLKDIGAKNRVKDLIFSQTQRLSAWKKIHYVSMTNYEWIRSQGGSLARKAELLPHPIPYHPRMPRSECRQQLDIPEDGRYLGLAALLDTRKAIPELLSAFRAVAGPDDRLLLAGRLHPGFAGLINDEYSDLVEQRRIILINRYFDTATSDLVLGALDVICTPYPRFGQLSSAMLHGVAAGKPVLVHDFGWMRAMVRRFGFGWTCDVTNPNSFASGIRESLDQSQDYQETEATRRLIEFHSPENFTESWLQGIRETMGLPVAERGRSWSWVLEALYPDRQPTTCI